MQEHNLERFVVAQKAVFQSALTEIQHGRKQGHWMWYVFPQIQGLGFTETSTFYGLQDLDEAAAYLQHRILGPRLVLISNVLLEIDRNDAYQIFGSPDDLKLKSCMTLFASVPGADPVFDRVLLKFYNGLKDHKTLRILAMQQK